MTRPELIHGLIFAGAPVILFVGFIAMVAFVPISGRRRLTPWLLGLLGVAVAAFLAPTILAGVTTDLSLPLALLGGAVLTAAGQLKPRGFGYAAAVVGALALFGAGAVFFVPAFQKGEAPEIAGLILVAAVVVPALLAFFKIKDIRAGRHDASAEHHPMGTGTTA